MTPDDNGANWAKVDRDRSRIRPASYGPRSSTRQLTERPVLRSVTVSSVPKGNDWWAQVPAGASYQDAGPVSLGRGTTVVGGVGRAATPSTACVLRVTGGAGAGSEAASAATTPATGTATGGPVGTAGIDASKDRNPSERLAGSTTRRAASRSAEWTIEGLADVALRTAINGTTAMPTHSSVGTNRRTGETRRLRGLASCEGTGQGRRIQGGLSAASKVNGSCYLLQARNVV